MESGIQKPSRSGVQPSGGFWHIAGLARAWDQNQMLMRAVTLAKGWKLPHLKRRSLSTTNLTLTRRSRLVCFIFFKLRQQERSLRGSISCNFIRYDILLVTVRRRLKSNRLLLLRRTYNESLLNTFMEVWFHLTLKEKVSLKTGLSVFLWTFVSNFFFLSGRTKTFT